MKKYTVIVWAFIFVCWTINIDSSTYKMVGYFPNWLAYPRTNTTEFPNQAAARPLFTPANIDLNTSKLTHVFYAFAKPYTLNADPDCLANTDPSKDDFSNVAFNDTYWNSGIKSYKVSLVDPWCDTCMDMTYNGKTYKGHLATLKALKADNPNLKTLISIGGYTIFNQGAPAVKFSAMAANASSRADFINSVFAFCTKYGFDGVDLDWEYPTFNGGTADDAANYTQLLKEFRTAIDALGYPFLLTIAAPCGDVKMAAMQISQMYQYLDWFNLMAYDFNGSTFSVVTGHNAPLYAPSYSSKQYGDGPNYYVDYAVQYFLQQGVPASKLVLGIPLYGRSFANVPGTPMILNLPGLYNSYSGYGSQTTDDVMGYQTWPNITTTLLNSSGYTRYWDDTCKVPYLYNATTKDLISYDDDQSMGVKAEYIITNKLGGAMFWQLENEAPIWSSIGLINSTLNNSNPAKKSVAPIKTTPTTNATATPAQATTATTTQTEPAQTSRQR